MPTLLPQTSVRFANVFAQTLKNVKLFSYLKPRQKDHLFVLVLGWLHRRAFTVWKIPWYPLCLNFQKVMAQSWLLLTTRYVHEICSRDTCHEICSRDMFPRYVSRRRKIRSCVIMIIITRTHCLWVSGRLYLRLLSAFSVVLKSADGLFTCFKKRP